MANIKKVEQVRTKCISTPKKLNNKSQIIIDDDDDDVGVDDDGTPLRPIFCLKRKSAIKEYDDKEDCFILDFNPDEDSVDLSKMNAEKGVQNNPQDSPDVFMVAEKGQVACRDYPHSRHLCVKLPFQKTPHESYCNMCYCFVCDVSAPCKSWNGYNGHCHDIDNEGWKLVRNIMKKGLKS